MYPPYVLRYYGLVVVTRPRPHFIVHATVIKVMSIPNNRCIRVVIPDDHVGTNGFHKVLIHDMDEADPPFVTLGELGCLRLDWPRAIFSFMGRHQVDLEHLRYAFQQHPVWTVYVLWKVYSAGSGQTCHLFSLGSCPALAVPGVLVHCIDHMGKVHSVPAMVKAANLA